jgi:aryl-alcohol dehydrogenase-like predicted oxidoreductase
METRFLGTTGLQVSTLALGTMGFGGGAQSPVGTIDVDAARHMVGLALDAGVNLFDTANSYSGGRAEEVLGQALGCRRDEVLISTKVHARTGDGVNDVGQSRWNIVRACEASLRRLGTDHIDLFHVHGFDGCTPLEESLGALDRLVRSGKVRYLACSNHAAWQIAWALGISAQRGLDRYVAVQAYYSLVARELEWDVIPACEALGLGILVWSPLAGGLLSGKFRPDATPAGTRRAMVGDLGVGPVDHERAWRILAVARDVASARGVSVAQVALNWVRANPAVSSVIVGARTAEQLADNLAAASWSLTPAERAVLAHVSATPLPYPHWFPRQFTAERFGPDGPPDAAAVHTYVPRDEA